jgi:hypothetical protein
MKYIIKATITVPSQDDVKIIYTPEEISSMISFSFISNVTMESKKEVKDYNLYYIYCLCKNNCNYQQVPKPFITLLNSIVNCISNSIIQYTIPHKYYFVNQESIEKISIDMLESMYNECIINKVYYNDILSNTPPFLTMSIYNRITIAQYCISNTNHYIWSLFFNTIDECKDLINSTISMDGPWYKVCNNIYQDAFLNSIARKNIDYLTRVQNIDGHRVESDDRVSITKKGDTAINMITYICVDMKAIIEQSL